MVDTLRPSCRAFGGMLARKTRADLAPEENGLNLVEISVMNRVIMLLVVELCGELNSHKVG